MTCLINIPTPSPYLGRPIEEVLAELRAAGVRARVKSIDNKACMLTMDMVLGRLNFAVQNGKITEVSEG